VNSTGQVSQARADVCRTSGTPVMRRELVVQGVQATLLIHLRPIVLHTGQ
jgi:hypothetical protein